MIFSKETFFNVERKASTTTEAANNPLFQHFRGEYDQVLTTNPSISPPSNLIQPMPDLGVSQPPSFARITPQFHLGELSVRPTLPPIVTRCKVLFGFQLLQANIGYQRANELLSNMYQMIGLCGEVNSDQREPAQCHSEEKCRVRCNLSQNR